MGVGNGPLIPRPALRQVPSATYEDVCGQEDAVRAVRDLIELPMRHGALFEAVGAQPRPGGVILAGPPGTGKTLLARAVAASCGAHLELVGGPELLSPYVGASEQALRQVFERATQAAPALIVFDELDAFAPSRQHAEAQHQQALVAQLLTLLDGLEPRRAVYVIATTNRPQAIDPALRRPGRFDRVVTMDLPRQAGRAAILRHHLTPLRLADGLEHERLAQWLAARTRGASGADLAHLCQSAARLCVRQELEYRERRDSPGQSPLPEHNMTAITTIPNPLSTNNIATPPLAITHAHFEQALREWLAEHAPSSPRPD
jgi:transitional endoplasmic reticulum ATPase